MTVARSRLIDPQATPAYHIVCRCVRRAWLCGDDPLSGINYDHRREWIREKIEALSQAFCIDVYAYAVMSNHYHLVLNINTDEAKSLSSHQVATRWTQLYKGHNLVQRYLGKSLHTPAEKDQTTLIIESLRKRLCDISWFMKTLNESIARQANAEDNCTGSFWESRFKSQALLDEQALYTCMAYVDLNPIRADMAQTPEQSDYTSLQARIKHTTVPTALTPFKDQVDNPMEPPERHSAVIDFEYKDYLQLVDWSGRAILHNKRGSIPEDAPPILTRLGLAKNDWLNAVQYHESRFPKVAGRFHSIIQYAKRMGKRIPKGMRENALFSIPET